MNRATGSPKETNSLMKISKTMLLTVALAAVAVPSAWTLRVHHQAILAAAPPIPETAVDAHNADGTYKYVNRLIHEQSPYLLQHAHNPVDWYPWGPAAFAKARRENKPIFLSVGYATCHWCHVMERESFSQPDVAKRLNDSFVSVKVDREERPDVDAVYMTAVQIATGSGGWPETTILLPDGRPFFGGTYLPKDDLMRLLSQASDAYRHQGPQVIRSAARLTAAMRQAAARQDRGQGPLTAAQAQASVQEAVSSLRDTFDPIQGGFGGVPKFPPHGSLALLLARSEKGPAPGALLMATKTLDAMALGGIHDQLGGGFHRYSTDAAWKLPHFEKMLYDNALLGASYTDAYQRTGSARYKVVADGIYGWVRREMTDPGGGFYSALDADAGGTEGGSYIWTLRQITDALGPDDGAFFARVYNVQEDGNYEEQATGRKTGANVLYLSAPPPAADAPKLAALRARLLAVRETRLQPRRDDKVLAGWNGLMIGSLARAGKTLNEPQDTAAAEKAAAFAVKTFLRPDGTLWRRWRAGVVGIPAFQDDYAYLADGLLDLTEATGDRKWIAPARRLIDTMRVKFRDSDGGFFEEAAADHLLVRLKDPYDNALPSGNGVAARVLMRLSRLTGDRRYAADARAAVAAFGGALQRSPSAMPTLTLAAADILGPGIPISAPVARLPAAHAGAPIQIRAAAAPAMVHPGGIVRVTVRLIIQPGWHINSDQPHEADLIPTRITLGSGGIPATLASPVRFPAAQTLTLGGMPLSVYQRTAELTVRALIGKSAQLGAGRLQLRVHYQPCSDRLCLVPVTRVVSVPVRVSR